MYVCVLPIEWWLSGSGSANKCNGCQGEGCISLGDGDFIAYQDVN